MSFVHKVRPYPGLINLDHMTHALALCIFLLSIAMKGPVKSQKCAKDFVQYQSPTLTAECRACRWGNAYAWRRGVPTPYVSWRMRPVRRSRPCWAATSARRVSRQGTLSTWASSKGRETSLWLNYMQNSPRARTASLSVRYAGFSTDTRSRGKKTAHATAHKQLYVLKYRKDWSARQLYLDFERLAVVDGT